MSDSVRPQRWQPNRLLCPWDSPGKNTGVGCHFLLHCMKVESESEVAQSCPTLSDPMDCSLPGSSVHGVFQSRVLEWVVIAFSKRRHIFPQIFNLTWNYNLLCPVVCGRIYGVPFKSLDLRPWFTSVFSFGQGVYQENKTGQTSWT